MKKLLLVSIAALIGIGSIAQDSTRLKARSKKDRKSEKLERMNTLLKQEEEEGEIIFQKHSVFGLKLATDGYGILYERGKYISPRKTNLLQFELNEKLSNKEEKSTAGIDIFGNVSQAKYAKANNFYQFKAGLGQQYTIGGKANKNGVAVSAIYAGGVSLGIMKPYFVDVENVDTGERLRVDFKDPIFDTTSPDIKGASGFTVGWNKVKFSPGLHAKAALRFDYGRFNETVTALEAGLNAEYYTSKVVQMAIGNSVKQERRFFFNAYIALEFGRRK